MAPSPHRRRLLLILPVLVAAAVLWGALAADAGADTCKAWLVQSIPTDMPHLRRVPGVLSTGIYPLLSLALCITSLARVYGSLPVWGIRCRRHHIC